MPEAEEEQFTDATPDVIVEEELDYSKDVIKEEVIDRPDEQETDTQEADIEDSDVVETDGQKMPIFWQSNGHQSTETEAARLMQAGLVLGPQGVPTVQVEALNELPLQRSHKSDRDHTVFSYEECHSRRSYSTDSSRSSSHSRMTK